MSLTDGLDSRLLISDAVASGSLDAVIGSGSLVANLQYYGSTFRFH